MGERLVTAFPLMGSRATLTTPVDTDPTVVRRACVLLRSLEARLTVNGDARRLAGSQVEAINRAAGAGPVTVDADVYACVRAAVLASREHRASFNALLGPVVKAWNVGFDHPRVPTDEELARLLGLTDPDAVELDDARRSIRLGRAGMRLDLGAIAKGFAADQVALLLRAAGLPWALIDLGGNVMALGGSDLAEGLPWRVGIQAPFSARGTVLGAVELKDASAVTSGTYERQFEAGGRRYHHMIDPRTGYPFATDVASVTVLSKSSETADLWATVLQAAGSETGLLRATARPDIEAIVVTVDGSILCTPGCASAFLPVDRPRH